MSNLTKNLIKEFADSLVATGYPEEMANKIAEQMFGQLKEEGEK